MFKVKFLPETNVKLEEQRDCTEIVAKFPKNLGKTRFNFRESTVNLLVSIGNTNFEGDELRALLKLIKCRFKKGIIIVGDTLQRFTILAEHFTDLSFTIKLAEEETKKRGDKWIEEYRKELEGYEIERWEKWRFHKNFEQAKAMIVKTLESNVNYRADMEDSKQEYGERFRKKIEEGKYKKNKKNYDALFEQYFVEECAVFIIFAMEGQSLNIYPKKAPKIVQATIDLILNRDNHKFLWIPVVFTRRALFNGNMKALASIALEEIEEIINKLNPDQRNQFWNLLNENVSSERREELGLPQCKIQ